MQNIYDTWVFVQWPTV